MDCVTGVMACKRSSVRTRPASSHESPQRLRFAGFVVDRATRQTEALFCLPRRRAPRLNEVTRNSVVVCQSTVKRPHVGATKFRDRVHSDAHIQRRCAMPAAAPLRFSRVPENRRAESEMCNPRWPDTMNQPRPPQAGGCWGSRVGARDETREAARTIERGASGATYLRIGRVSLDKGRFSVTIRSVRAQLTP